MSRANKLCWMTLFVAGALAADALVGCATESEPGQSLNPQPLPPNAPPEDGADSPEAPPPASEGEPVGDGTVGSSSGSSGAAGSTDAGGN